MHNPEFVLIRKQGFPDSRGQQSRLRPAATGLLRQAAFSDQQKELDIT